ncbi:hypothetical protein EDB80DRAFT_302091 [Ilyonectria destructans]|nr:hypothetical protein EDB80DRAFT_302091 [Ilyonectria destructans]
MSDEGPVLAIQACSTCRTQKRKCTKELPECALCKRSGRPCNYGVSTLPVKTSERHVREASTGRSSHGSSPSTFTVSVRPPGRTSLTASEPVHTDFPALFFLDFEYFQLKRHAVDKVCLGLPQELGSCLEGHPQNRYDVDVYFNSVHIFLPIVSKLRLYQELSNSQNGHNADTTLLLIAMRLHTQSVDDTEPAHRELYRAAKASFSYVEASNIFSIRLMQAALLIALYEMSNAIFPAAYLSVGHCARLGHAMGIHDRKRAPQMLCSPKTSTESEERRRAWWATIVLDRYVNIGITGCPFAAVDARLDDYLPIDDKYWDTGELTMVEPLAISTSTTAQASPFARTCQAAHLLSRVLRHKGDTDTDNEFRHEEAIQLHLTVQALYSTILHESEGLITRMSDLTGHTSLYTAMALCLSALLSLYDKYSCIENADVNQLRSLNFREMHKIAIAGVKEASNSVHKFSEGIRAAADLGGMLKTSPLVCDCLYQAVATYLWRMQETGSSEFVPRVMGIMDLLKMLGTKWKSPREYVKILESYEMPERLPT